MHISPYPHNRAGKSIKTRARISAWGLGFVGRSKSFMATPNSGKVETILALKELLGFEFLCFDRRKKIKENRVNSLWS